MGRGARTWSKPQFAAPRPPGRPAVWNTDRIDEELRAFCGDRSTWPTVNEFRAAGRADLIAAARRYGGQDVWAQRLGLGLADVQIRPGLTHDEAVKQARQVVAELGRLPGAPLLRKAGYPKLATYVMNHGGSQRFTDRWLQDPGARA